MIAEFVFVSCIQFRDQILLLILYELETIGFSDDLRENSSSIAFISSILETCDSLIYFLKKKWVARVCKTIQTLL